MNMKKKSSSHFEDSPQQAAGSFKLFLLILLISFFSLRGVAICGEKQPLDVEEREIVEILEILENYDFLISMELYRNLDEVKNFENTQSSDKYKEEGGKK